MATTVGVHEAKAHLSRLLNQVRHGEEVIITRDGKPIARLVGLAAGPARRTPGSAAGRLVLRDDLEDPLPDDVLSGFERR